MVSHIRIAMLVVLAAALVLTGLAVATTTAGESDSITCPSCSVPPVGHAAMHPDQETLDEWLTAYEEAPVVPVEHRTSIRAPGPGQSVDLLPFLDYVPGDRNQGGCGNCWVWAGTGIMEIAHNVENSVDDRLSTQYFNSHFNSGGNSGRFACCGGWLDEFADFYDNENLAVPWTNTLANWQDWSTGCAKGAGRTTIAANTIGTTPRYSVGTINDQRIITLGVGTAAAIQNIKNVLDDHRGVWFSFFGPDSASFSDFDSRFWATGQSTDLYDFAQWDGRAYDSPAGQGWGHAVMIVGYDDTSANPDDHYWLVLNSWGTTANRADGTFRAKMNINYDASMTGYGTDSGHYLQFMTLDIDFPNTAPTVSAGGPYTASEGSAISFAASATDAEQNPLTYRWDFQDDGVWDTAASADSTASHVYPDDWTGNARVEVSDGEFTATATAAVTVNNVAPAIAAIPDQAVNEDEIFVVSGTFTDPGADDWTVDVDYGDGTVHKSLSSHSFAMTPHSYCELGDHTVTVRIGDDDGGVDTESFTVTVVNVPPVADAGTAQTVPEGTAVQFQGSVTAGGACDVLKYEWAFGDGATATGTLTPTHTYGDNGAYTVTLKVTDDDGASSTASVVITVTNVNPAVTRGAMDQPNSFFILPAVHTLTFHGTFADPGWLDTHTALWTFGDGTSVGTLTEENAAPDATGTVTAAHAFDAPGDYSVIVTVTDDDGGATTSAAWAVHVADAAEAKHVLGAYIQALPDSAFKNNPQQRRNSFNNVFKALDDKLRIHEWNGFVTSIVSDVRSKADGLVDGKPNDDWITAKAAQQNICKMIDDIVAYVKTFM